MKIWRNRDVLVKKSLIKCVVSVEYCIGAPVLLNLLKLVGENSPTRLINSIDT